MALPSKVIKQSFEFKTIPFASRCLSKSIWSNNSNNSAFISSGGKPANPLKIKFSATALSFALIASEAALRNRIDLVGSFCASLDIELAACFSYSQACL